MQNFQDIFETRRRSFISIFSICMNVPLKSIIATLEKGVKYVQN